MVTFSVTIDEESHKDLFLRIMEELKFVVSVTPEGNAAPMKTFDFALPGREATDEELERLMVLAEKSETYTPQKSQELNEGNLINGRKKASNLFKGCP
jgi:hypothetical protein